jgi:hypothetical protein
MAAKTKPVEPAAPETAYIRVKQATYHIRFGKVAAGRCLPLPADEAEAWIDLGLAENISESQYEKGREEHYSNLNPHLTDQEAYNKLNDPKAKLWDVSTHRDASMASEEGLRAAQAAGLSLVNTQILKDKDGKPLPPDATVDEIMEARSSMTSDDKLHSHERSSTMGGGSHYTNPNPVVEPVPDPVLESIAKKGRKPSSRASGNGPHEGDN